MGGIVSAVACDLVPKFELVGFLGLPRLRVRLGTCIGDKVAKLREFQKVGNFSWEFMGINRNHGRSQGFKNTQVKNEGPTHPPPCQYVDFKTFGVSSVNILNRVIFSVYTFKQ